MPLLLESIASPEDLKTLPLSDCLVLAKQIRQKIIDVVSIHGGHLASGLGAVEFTIALHKVFSSPIDQLVFDVSHQTYPHKLLTGRQELFESLRQYQGCCGFTSPKESPHDHFYAGHAGTALSLSLGLAHARDLTAQNHHVIPVIGDATLTCGLALEALNNIPSDLKRFLVILNDNEMSISKNVGGITNILARLLSHPRTHKWVHKVGKGAKLIESVRHLVSPASFFEQFGLAYVGPIDGHNLNRLIPLLESLKASSMPTVLHLITQKGHGLDQAAKNPITFHGAKPFDTTTCEFLPKKTSGSTFPKIFGKHIVALGEKDPSLCVITPAMSLGSSLDAFMQAFPERSFDVGIAEGHAVTFAGGLAKTKQLNVICSIYATFLQRALDNLFHDVCLQEIPVVFAIDRAGISGPDGPTHHGVFDIGFLKTMPHMVICQPRDGRLLKELLEVAFSWKRPTAIRYPNLPTTDEKAGVKRKLGKGELVCEGEDLLLIPLGILIQEALLIKKRLKKEGLSAAIFDPIFLKPLDKEALTTLFLKHKRIVTLEEHSLKGGLGNEVNALISEHDFSDLSVLNFGLPDAFIEHGSRAALLDEVGMSVEKMVKRIQTHFSLQPLQPA